MKNPTTIPEIYKLAADRIAEKIEKLGTAHPEYQEELKRQVARITRENALDKR